MALTTKTARSLAIAYEAYIDARNRVREETDPVEKRSALNSLCCWARMLKDAQEATGVEFYSPESLDAAIRYARRDISDMDLEQVAA